MGAGELFALDAKTGKRLWSRRAGGLLRGVGDDGRTTVVSLMSTTGRGTSVLAISHDGEVIRQIEDEAAIGVPAVVDTYAFLPWQGQYVTVYDLIEGRERARVLLRTQVSRAFVQGGAVFFGEAGATRLDDKIRLAPRSQASTVTLPARELPGQPRWLGSGTDARPIRSGAHDRIAIYARPTASGAAAFEDNRFAATYYRIAVGFDASQGNMAWAHAHDADFIGGAAFVGGFALCDVRGNVTFIDAKNGGVTGHTSMGKPLEACVVQTDGLTKPAGPAAPPLAEQLAKAVSMPETEHVMIQKLLLREMAGNEDPSVTKVLIDLASNPRTPPLLLEDARKALAARRNGVDHMLTALGRHYDFLADVLRPPPVGPMAEALGALREKKAAPLLAAHLNDPADTPDDARRTAAALVLLGDKPELPALSTFFAHYRGAAEDDAIVEAVVSSAQAMIQLGADGPVSDAVKDAYTTDAIKPRLEALLRARKPEPRPGGAGAADPKKPDAKATPAKDSPDAKVAPAKAAPDSKATPAAKAPGKP
jgi:outer membrane protein assembly factor BamB